MVFTTEECLKALLFSRRKRRGAGQTTVEFALICLPFFIILFAIIDFAEIFFYENSLQNGLREACRFATAGRVIQLTDANGNPVFETNSSGITVPKAIPSKYGSGQEASRNECIRYWFLSNCVLNVPVSNISIVSAPALPGVEPTTITNNVGYGYVLLRQTNGGLPFAGPGQINDYVQITATYHVGTITPLMGYMSGYNGVGSSFPVHVSAIIKNEPATLNFQKTAIYTNEP